MVSSDTRSVSKTKKADGDGGNGGVAPKAGRNGARGNVPADKVEGASWTKEASQLDDDPM